VEVLTLFDKSFIRFGFKRLIRPFFAEIGRKGFRSIQILPEKDVVQKVIVPGIVSMQAFLKYLPKIRRIW
jgi:hypothetical protein